MQRTRHQVALAGHATTVVAHGFGCGDDFAAVVRCVAESDEVHHCLLADGKGFTRSAEWTQPRVTTPGLAT